MHGDPRDAEGLRKNRILPVDIDKVLDWMKAKFSDRQNPENLRHIIIVSYDTLVNRTLRAMPKSTVQAGLRKEGVNPESGKFSNTVFEVVPKSSVFRFPNLKIPDPPPSPCSFYLLTFPSGL